MSTTEVPENHEPAPLLGLGSSAVLGVLPPERAEDAISRSKRILAMVDTYCARPDSMNRTALRVALMGEFEDARAQGRDDFGPDDMAIMKSALIYYTHDKTAPRERRDRAYAMWQVLRMG